MSSAASCAMTLRDSLLADVEVHEPRILVALYSSTHRSSNRRTRSMARKSCSPWSRASGSSSTPAIIGLPVSGVLVTTTPPGDRGFER